jgi:hemerythrin HHE cation binding domain-containing protein
MAQPMDNVTARHIRQHSGPPSASSAVGLAGVFETLVDQHRQMAAELRAVSSMEASAERQRRWSELRRRLLSHERAETLEVYAALDGIEAARIVLQQHRLQVSELEGAIRELDAMDPNSERWDSQIRDVMALFDDHAEDEQSSFFPRAQQILGAKATRDLRERYLTMQREVAHSVG